MIPFIKLALVLAASALFADPQIGPQIGKDTYGEETLESLQVLGTVKLNGTTISKSIKVTGNLIAHCAFLNQVEAAGDIQLFDTTIEQAMQATGSIKAFGSIFRQPLVFLGQRGLFSACQMAALTVQRDLAFKSAQIIELKDKTQVDGPILFENGGGKVLLYPGSRVKGPVTGGRIVHKN